MKAFIAAVLVPFAAVAAKRLPPVDAASDAPPARAFVAEPWVGSLIAPGTQVHTDDRFGLPTFVWAPRHAASSIGARPVDAKTAARAHLEDYAGLYGLSPAAARAAELRALHDTGQGGIIASFAQRVGGVPVFRTELHILLDRQQQVVALSGNLSPDTEKPIAAFRLDARDAIARAVQDLRGVQLAEGDLAQPVSGADGMERHAPTGTLLARTGVKLDRPARTQRVLFPLPGALEPATYVEVHLSDATRDSASYAYVFSAVDGRMLLRHDLVANDTYTYRVFADPSSKLPYLSPQGHAGAPYVGAISDAQPPYVTQQLVTLANYPFSQNDPWLGANATETRGNNVDAYVDLVSPDGFSANTADFRAPTSAANTFDWTYDTSQAPGASTTQRRAAITQLFYMNNFLHDWYYDDGFDEAAGNAQLSNYGRGGVEGDPVHAEAQDYSGVDNANMMTPADGDSPRMQMYLFQLGPLLTAQITAPASIAGLIPDATVAQFGPQAFDVQNSLVVAQPVDACGALTNGSAVSGHIALIERGTCNFSDKVIAAQNAGAIGVVVTNNVDGVIVMAGTDPTVTIPSVCVTLQEGNTIRAALGSGPVTFHMSVVARVDRDGAIDEQIVAHEWGHYISNRLIGNSNGIINNIATGMGEGWADFHSLLFTVRAEDASVSGNDSWQASYGLGTYASYAFERNTMYFGIRRYPYSTDLTKSPLTFKYIQDGVPLPAGVPVAGSFSTDGTNNSEVHNTGEIWAAMLWECYAALLRDTTGSTPRLTFAQAQDRMKRYIVAAYKLTPIAPTMLEARDAVLAAAAANDPTDHALFVQAFAKRGAGVGAIGPDRYTVDNVGVTESFSSAATLELGAATLDDSDAGALCGRDHALQGGESGTLTLSVRNPGDSDLTGVSATVSSAALTFPSGATIDFGTVAAGASVEKTVAVALPAATTARSTDITLTFASPSGLTLTAQRMINVDAVAQQSATDDVEAPASAWNVTFDPKTGTDAASFASGKWRIETIAPGAPSNTGAQADHRWFAPDFILGADQTLVSPPLDVGNDGFKVAFTHRYNIGFFTDSLGNPQYVDGGVVELSTDNGATWTDIGRSGSPGYSGTVARFGGPLDGRPAFVGASTGWPAQRLHTVLDLGTGFAGKTVLIRFRFVTLGIGGWGWELDDIALTGVGNLPFTVGVPRTGAACNVPPTAHAQLSGTPAENAAVGLDGTGSSSGVTAYRWFQISGPAATIANPAAAQTTFTVSHLHANSTLKFGLIVSNGALYSAPDTVTAQVAHTPIKPVANAGAAQSVQKGATVTLDGTASADSVQSPLTYQWTQTSGPQVTLSSATVAQPTFMAPQSGTMEFKLVVNNQDMDSDAATTTVSVKSGCGCSTDGGSPLGSVVLMAVVLAYRAGKRRSSRKKADSSARPETPALR